MNNSQNEHVRGPLKKYPPSPALDEPKYVFRTRQAKVRLTGDRKRRAEAIGGGSVSARLAADLIKLVGSPIKVLDKDWYLGEHGRWRKIKDAKKFFRRKGWKVQALPDRNPRRTRDVLDAVIDQHHLEENEKFYGCLRHDVGDDFYLINCLNSVLKVRLADGTIIDTLKPHLGYMFTTSLGADLDPKAVCPLFLEVLAQVLPDKDDQELFLLWFAYTLLPDCRLETSMFWVGSGGNGKSIITAAVMAAIGEENSIGLKMQTICDGDRKHMFRLENKLVCIATETDPKSIYENSNFKKITTGEPIETDKLYEPGFQLKTSCKLGFICNKMVKFKEGSNADSRRVRMLNFPNRFDDTEKRETLISAKLAQEKAGILKLLIDRLPIVATLKQFPLGGSDTRSQLKTFTLENNPYISFCDACLNVTGTYNDYLLRPHVHECFQTFVSVNNINVGTMERGQLYQAIYRYKPQLQSNYEETKVFDGKKERIIRKVRFTELGQQLLARRYELTSGQVAGKVQPSQPRRLNSHP